MKTGKTGVRHFGISELAESDSYLNSVVISANSEIPKCLTTVTYDKVVRLADRNLPDTTTRHVASVVYEYQPKVLAKERDRLENPFGFVVTAYRSDPEINTAAPPAAKP